MVENTRGAAVNAGWFCWLTIHLVLCFRRSCWLQQTVEKPQLQFICVVVDLPVVAHMLSLMVQTARRTIETPQLLVYKVVNVPVMRDVRVPRVRRGEDSCSLSCSSLRKVVMSSGGGSFLPMMLTIVRGTALCRRKEYTINYFQYQDVVGCRDVVRRWIFTPDGAYDSVLDSVRPMTGKYIIYYFQYQEFVWWYACWIPGSAATTRFAPTTTTIPGSS